MATILMLPVAGCASATLTSGNALCDGSRADRAAHAAALAEDGGPLSLVTGQRLISRIDRGCAQ